ncbi:hypothetical protein ACHAXT_003471, partial [Thalassiosira profunda]
MKLSRATVTIVAAALGPIAPANAVNFLVIQPDDLDFYDDWNPPAFLPWAPNPYPGASYPTDSTGAAYPLPWINKLRAEGLEMTQAYAASPKCGTSRYSTITGRYASRSARSRNRNDGDAPPADVSIPKTKLANTNAADGQDCSRGNLAQLFSQNNWTTGVVGKWHLSSMSDLADVKLDVESCGFDDVEAMYPDNINNQSWVQDTHHNMEYVAYKAVEFIQDNNGHDWFLYMNPTAPHGPSIDEAFGVDCRSTVDGDFSDPATLGHPGAGWDVPAMTEDFGGDCAAYRQNVRDRAGGSDTDADLGSIWVDDAIGAVYTALQRTGQLDDTVILFQLDHGKVNKDEIWEGGVRIPQFVHWPSSIPNPKTFDGIVSTIDIGPTFLEIAGIDSSNPHFYPMDGKSWLSAINDSIEEDDWKANRCLFFESGFERSVRCGCDKFTTLSAGSNELATAVANIGVEGWSGFDAATSEVYTDLCGPGREYVVAADNPNKYSPEARNEAAAAPQKVADLRALLNCHLTRTGQSGAVMNKNDVPQYVECAGSIATPAPTVSPRPTLPVASGEEPQLVSNDPALNDVREINNAQVLQVTVLDNDIASVRFNVRDPNGSTTGFNGAAQVGTLVSSSGHESVHEFTIDTTANNGNFTELLVGDANSVPAILDAARERIGDLIQAEPALAAKFVRHSFHDCVGGCDGCVDLLNGDNNGLDIVIDALEPVVDMFARWGVTRADIWVLAGLEGARSSQNAGADNRDFDMDWYGRPTCETMGYDPSDCSENSCTSRRGPNGANHQLPSPNLSNHGLLQYFSDAFGFDARQTVAIMGAHSLGTMARENSGYDAPAGWKPQNRRLDSGYYDQLVGGDAATAPNNNTTLIESAGRWEQALVDNSDLADIDDKWQWELNNFVMLTSDIAVVRDLDGLIEADGSVPSCQFKCTRANNCPAQPQCPWSNAYETLLIAEEYKHDEASFLVDFEDAFLQMLEFGDYTTDENGPCDPMVA